MSETLLNVSFSDASNGTAVGQLGTILRTTDGGQTWVREESGTNQDLYGVSFPQINAATTVGSYWRHSSDDNARSDTAANDDTQAASHTRAAPDTLSSVAGSRTVILAREGISATGAVPNHVHTVLLNRLASGSHFASNRSVTFLLQRLIGFAAVCLKILLAFFAGACAISRLLNRRASAAIRHNEIPNAGA